MTTFRADFRHRIRVLLVWMLAYGAVMAGHVTMAYIAPREISLENVAQTCARELGIPYTYEDGATEQLDAFSDCLLRYSSHTGG